MNFSVCATFSPIHTNTPSTITILSHFKQPNCNLVGFDFPYTEVLHMNLYVAVQLRWNFMCRFMCHFSYGGILYL